MLIDTHSHLYDTAFDGDRQAALDRAEQVGVEVIMLPAIDSQTHSAMIDLARKEPRCKPMTGVHPTAVNDNPGWRDELSVVEKHLAAPPAGIEKFYGIGETGIDMHWSRDWLAQQIEAFEAQIELALKYDLPLVIHARDAWPEIFAVMEKYRYRGLRGIMHAFSGGVEEYRRIGRAGDFMFGISGVVTYKKSALHEVVRAMSINHIVLETDCPYLTPEPHRGSRNESAHLVHIRDRVAEIMGLPPDAIEEATTRNAQKMFAI